VAEPAASDLELATADGVALVGHRFEPNGAPRANVVLVHGFAATSGEERVVALAEAFRADGLAVLTYDARGHGRSGGETTLGDLEQHDVAAAVGAASHPDRPTIVVGASMGAIGVLRYAASAAASGTVDGLVVLSCPARWRLPRNARGAASAALTQTPPGRWFARRSMGVRIATHIDRPAPPIDLVAQVGVPIAILHGTDDPFIAPSAAEELHAAAADPRRLHLVDGLGHAYEPESIQPLLDSAEWLLSR
jgi:alpha-beta hydrolase superfamily lysophospholipase